MTTPLSNIFLRAPARGLGRQRHQDRDAGTRGKRRHGRAASGTGFPKLAPQQAQHDAQSQKQGRRRRVQAHGEKGRRRRRELPARRQAPARHRLQGPRQDQPAASSTRRSPVSARPALMPAARASTRSRKAWAG